MFNIWQDDYGCVLVNKTKLLICSIWQSSSYLMQILHYFLIYHDALDALQVCLQYKLALST